MAELADAQDLGSCGAIRAGSIPVTRTTIQADGAECRLPAKQVAVMLEYRKALPEDIPILAQMRLAMLCESADYPEAFRRALHDNTCAYLARGLEDRSLCTWLALRRDGLIAAMGSAAYYTLPPNDWCPGGRTAYISNLYTLPDYRRQGVASSLLRLLLDEAKENGCERILLDASDMGRPLYRKFGFKDSDSAMAYYPFGIIPI